MHTGVGGGELLLRGWARGAAGRSVRWPRGVHAQRRRAAGPGVLGEEKGKGGRRDLRRIRGARSAMRRADHACSVGCVRGLRVNRVMDTGVGSGLREVGRKRV